MEVNIYGRNIKVSERLHDYVEDKVQKFEKLGDNVSDIDVKFTKEGHLGGNVIRVEITVIGRGPVLRAESQGPDKFAVFDETYGKLLERLRRARDRRKLRKHGGKHPVSVADATGSIPVVGKTAITEILLPDVPVEEAAFDTTEVTLSDEAASPLEIRHKSFPGERLSPAEAVDHMELVGHDFYLYIDKETGAPAAAYRRKGWSYGIITLTDE